LDDTSNENDLRDTSTRITMSDEEIIVNAMQHDLPLFVSIDGNLNNRNGNATVSISIVAPDIAKNRSRY